MKKSILILLACLFVSHLGITQNAVVEGYVFEDGGRGYLNQVKINVYQVSTNDFIEQVLTNRDGFFTISLPKNVEYKLEAYKDIFEMKEMGFSTSDDDKTFLKVIMRREEGYLFEVTLAPKRESEDIAVDGITGALIEVYNNTKQEEVLVLENHASPDFKIQFKKGNHYTVMVRKEGYLVKRMEAFVNVEGCILCFEGVGEIKPGVTDNLTEGLSMGTLLANVELEAIFEGKIIELQNIYYEFGKSKLTKQAKEELKKLANILEDNKHLTVEIGSHTDVRGTGPNNRALSDERAGAAVEYLTKERNVRSDRIIAVGYGESQIKNKCLPGVTCTEEEHGENRRTEMKILRIDNSGMPLKSLTSMKKEEEFERMVLGGGVEQVKIGKEGEKIADVVDDKILESEVVSKVKDVKPKKAEKEIEIEETAKSVEKKVESKEDIEKVQETAVREASKKKVEEEKQKSKVSAVSVKKEEKALTKEVAKKTGMTVEDVQGSNEEAFTGYRIVVHFTNFPISGDHEIYSKFDNVISYNTPQKNVLYMVGAFKTIKEAKSYRESRVESEFPSSYVVGFLNGKKITVE